METTLQLTEAPTPAPPTEASDSAEVEFRSALRLLAERAAFLTGATGVSILLREQEIPVPAASAGNKPSAAYLLGQPAIRECLESGKILRFGAQEEGFKLAVPVKDNEIASGLIAAAAQHEFTDDDQAALVRLADLVTVVVQHRRAAKLAASGQWEADESVVPQSWHAHAPAPAAAPASEAKSASVADVTAVRACDACGFPVSPGRTLCVECEQKTDVPVSAAAELFSMQKQESWLSEHGYTIASLIVSALAAMLILWLRK
jgi:hypothetical protein